jgi:hypothetical protein
MTKIVIQDRRYWLRDEFWQETRDSGFEATFVELKNGQFATRAIRREEFAAMFSGRVANWVKSEAKSVSVFREALGPGGRAKVGRLYREAIQVGLEAVAREFTARTGAQGKVRLPAEASFVVVIHTRAKDGSPQLHAHVAVVDRVRVRGQEKTYATHKRELYQLRKLFSAAVSHHFGHRLLAEFGVRVRKTDQGITLPDVPKELCDRSSVRTKQIDNYIKSHDLKNTPLSRKYAAIVTRRENRDPLAGHAAFNEALARSGFKAERICHRAKLDQSADGNRPGIGRETRRVERVAKRLAAERRSITRNDLLARALETAEANHPASRVKLATESVLRSPNKAGLRHRTNEHGRSVYVSRRVIRQSKRLAEKVEFVLSARAPQVQEQTRPQKTKRDGGNASPQSLRQTDRQARDERASERTTDLRRVVEKALLAYRVIGAVGHVGIKAAEIAAELYQAWAKPVWRVHGNGHKNTSGSVAKMVRDLKPLGVIESHKAAIAAMLKLNGTLDQKLRYGEYVYRQSRKAKFRIPRKCLIVIRDAGAANPKDVNFLLRKAEQAKAKTIFVEQEHSRFALLQMAKAMRPGERRHFQSQEMKR